MFTANDIRMMQRAIELAAQGRFSNHPNPRVGCVLAQGERIVGEGFHRKAGEPHAEPQAIAMAGAQARGATAYVTLEPHSYHATTPPCTDALIRAGVARVVCGALDPNPKVNGDGVRQLQAAGVAVQTGLLLEEVRELNLGFEKRMTTGLPRVIVKIAASLDGRIALANGASRWITGEQARADVQQLRAAASAVLTGVGTVLSDDPQLNVRDLGFDTFGRQPLRIVLDSRLRMPPTARLFQIHGETLVFTTAKDAARAAQLTDAGAQVIELAADEGGRVPLPLVLRALGERHCNDVLVEAGPTLVGQFIEQELADELLIYFAPMLLGADARPLATLPSLDRLDQAHCYRVLSTERIGADVKIRLRSSRVSSP